MDGETVFSSGTCLAPNPLMLSRYHEACMSGGGDSQMRGVFASVSVDKNAANFSVVVDPLSQYSLFTWQSGSSLCVSSSIYFIEAVAKAVGETLSRNPYVGCFETACTVGADTKTGYKDVFVQPFGTGVLGQGANWKISESKFQAFPEGASYEELLDLSAERLTGYAAALDKALPENGIIYDLTGGQDSRICFAAAVGAGVKGLNFFVGGNEGDDDKYVARRLAKTFGAREGNFPENYTETYVSAQEQARRSAFRQQGHSTLHHYALGKGRLENVGRVRGGAGELSRSHMTGPDMGCFLTGKPKAALKVFAQRDAVYTEALASYWGGVFDEKKRYAARWAYKVGNNLRGQKKLYTKTFRRHAVHSLMQEHYDYADTIDSMGMDTYFRDRTRRHFAFLARALNYSSGAFEFLYDPVMIAAAQALSWEDRASGRFVFDLMEKMAGQRILSIPFAAKSMQVKPRRHLAHRLDCSAEAITAVDRSSMPEVDRISIITGCGMNQWADFDGPKSLGIHGKYLWQNRKFMAELATDLPVNHELWTLLNRENFLEAVNGEYFFGGGHKPTHGLRFLHMLVWLSGEESAAGIEEIIS
ncbi:hypothetical protein [Kordiimonas laminariae]|uniref:hypothetical protein n=1 Tax=Kordiimonas laminariae TaxID=2917717 RepID=UPI001FF3F1FC|nr:hypothetical protein [Kordiimonas laminariae]MCK0070596.1 hypothetical protein [Kordiimonas laminariae]